MMKRKNKYSVEAILDRVHRESNADQSALYFLSYPGFDSLLLSHSTGRIKEGDRYWRNHCGETETIEQIRNAESSVLLLGKNITGIREKTVATPIRSGAWVIGAVIHCYDHHPVEDVERLSRVVEPYATDFFHAWIEFVVADQSQPLSVLLNMAGEVSSSLDLDRVLLSVVEQATRLFRAKMSSLMMYNKKSHELEMITAYGCSLEYLDKPNLPIEGSILGRVVKQNQIMEIPNIFEEPLYLHTELAAKEGVASLLAAPITFQEEFLGVLNIYSSNTRDWQQSERELLQTFADHAALAINNARVHEQILSMEEQLHVSSRLATLGELAAGLAHEIRNPLAVINMLIHSWKGHPPGEEDFQLDLNVIGQKVSDLNVLVSDLLNLGSSRSLDRQEQNMIEMIERVLRLLRHRITQQKVNIRKKFGANKNTMWVDRERMEQVFLNLMLNALDVTPEGEVIDLITSLERGHYVIHVADRGPGIPESKIPDLFKAFRTTKPKGAGLGLPISRRIVEEHKGRIEVKPNEPRGTVFSVWLPLD